MDFETFCALGKFSGAYKMSLITCFFWVHFFFQEILMENEKIQYIIWRYVEIVSVKCLLYKYKNGTIYWLGI